MNKATITALVLLLTIISNILYPQSSNQNYVHAVKVKEEGVKTESEFNALDDDEKLETINYYDGLGRPMQTVQKQYSPGGKDFIQHIEYDEFGREKKTYLPYAHDTESDGDYKSNVLTELDDFYEEAVKVAHTNYYYSEKEYDDSPLNRIEKQSAPGATWRLDHGHEVEFGYYANTSYEVRKWNVNMAQQSFSANGTYAIGTLYKNKTTDEDEHETYEYTDKQGKVVMKYVKLSSTEKLITYYLYDDYGNLAFVIPPKAVEILSNHSWNPYYLNNVDLVFKYKYDNRHRMTKKKIPGQELIYMVYDNRDNLIMTQDGNMRNNNKWLYTKYDILNRPMSTGFKNSVPYCDQEVKQEEADDYYELYPDRNNEEFIGVSTSVPHGYTSRAFPIPVNSFSPLSYTYYDNYDFIPTSVPTEYRTYKSYPGEFTLTSATDNTKGLVTGSKEKILDGTDNWLIDINYYDKFGRVIQTVTQNHLGGYDRITNEYNFIGNIMYSKHEHKTIIDSQTELTVLKYVYEYDHANRIKNVTLITDAGGIGQQFNINSMVYNELGQLVEKKLCVEANEEAVQTVDYLYNTRGWLKSINQPNVSNNSNVINVDDILLANEKVSAVIYDSLYFEISRLTSDPNDATRYLAMEIHDVKQLEIVEIDNPANKRYVQLDEGEKVEISDLTTDPDYFQSLVDGIGDSFEFNFNDMYYNEETTIKLIERGISFVAEQQLIAENITDTVYRNAIIQQVEAFTNKRVGLIYFREDIGDLFGMDIFYNDFGDNVYNLPQYNGNITGIEWMNAEDEVLRAYAYEYDNANRLLKADYRQKENSSWDIDRYTVDNISYDENGNIGTLKRYGLTGNDTYGLMDNLTYTYDGNRLDVMDDAITNISIESNDFRDNPGADLATEYTYDDNGNLETDYNLGITSIEYNYLNLPEKITFDPSLNWYIEYLYTATGKKLKTIFNYSDTPQIHRDYSNGFEYNDLELELIHHEEGRLVTTAVAGEFEAEYYLKDHLGNTRTVFKKEEQTGNVVTLQENHYYPFGMRFMGSTLLAGSNNYLYNGKEQQIDFGLHWYDYGARFYDAQLGRFHTLDPLCEKYSFQSPFVYGANNPIRFIDFMGMEPDEYQFNSHGQYTGKVEKEGEHYGTIASKDGQETTTFSFADPVNDPKAIDDSRITQVIEVSDEAIAETLDESGVNDSENQDNKYDFIQAESNATSPKGSGKMDYMITAQVEINGQKQPISSYNTLYITSTESGKVAHNNYNFGNFLWGAGAKSLGIPKFAAKLAAHYNSYFNDPTHKGKLDSKDDQYSISLGYEWEKPKN